MQAVKNIELLEQDPQELRIPKIVPPICKNCRNLKGDECKKNLVPKGKFGGGLKCKRFHLM